MGSQPQFRQSMDDLPEELTLKVLSYADQSSLYSCILASRRIYRIALPLLYRKITHHMYTAPSKLQSAVRTLIKRPELALKVETIALKDPIHSSSFWDIASWQEWAKESYNAALSSDDQPLFEAAARPLINMVSTSEHHAVSHHEEPQAALLIALAKNIKLLHIENPATEIEPARFDVDHLVLTSLYPTIKRREILQHLTTLHAITARLEGGQGGFRLSAIATFFHIPTLRRVVGVACFEPEDDLFQDFDCPVGQSNVNDLNFVRSSICPLGISQMLMACKAVESLDCDWAGSSVGWVEINFPILRENLTRHKGTIKRLRLDTRKHYDSWPERDDGLVPPMGAQLKAFTMLTKLDVPASALIGWDEENVGGYDELKDVLPPNLEELKINEHAPRLVDGLDEFAAVCSELYPKLKRISISREELEFQENSHLMEERLAKKFRDLAPQVRFEFEEGSEVDHFEGSIGSGSI